MLVHDRNPESMRTVPRVCAAGGDSVSGDPGICLFLAALLRQFDDSTSPNIA